jgi:hypothetical protein
MLKVVLTLVFIKWPCEYMAKTVMEIDRAKLFLYHPNEKG